MTSLIKQGRVQFGIETTPGTKVAATNRMAGAYTAEWKEDLNIDQPSFIDGSIAAASQGDIMGEMATLQTKSWMSFEDFVLCLACGLGGTGSGAPTGDGGTPVAQTWHSAPVLSGTLDVPGSGVKPATLEVGNLDLQEAGGYGLVRDFSFSWAAKQRAELTVNWIMRDLQPRAFTASIAKHVVERMAGSKMVLTVDDGQVTFPVAPTVWPGCVKSGVFNSGPLWVTEDCCDGNLYYTRLVRSSELKPELKVVVDVDANVAALRAKWRAGTTQLLQLSNVGSQIHGTSVVNKSMTMKMAALITDMGPVGTANSNGIATEEITFTGQEDSVAALLVDFTLVNKIAALNTAW